MKSSSWGNGSLELIDDVVRRGPPDGSNESSFCKEDWGSMLRSKLLMPPEEGSRRLALEDSLTSFDAVSFFSDSVVSSNEEPTSTPPASFRSQRSRSTIMGTSSSRLDPSPLRRTSSTDTDSPISILHRQSVTPFQSPRMRSEEGSRRLALEDHSLTSFDAVSFFSDSVVSSNEEPTSTPPASFRSQRSRSTIMGTSSSRLDPSPLRRTSCTDTDSPISILHRQSVTPFQSPRMRLTISVTPDGFPVVGSLVERPDDFAVMKSPRNSKRVTILETFDSIEPKSPRFSVETMSPQSPKNIMSRSEMLARRRSSSKEEERERSTSKRSLRHCSPEKTLHATESCRERRCIDSEIGAEKHHVVDLKQAEEAAQNRSSRSLRAHRTRGRVPRKESKDRATLQGILDKFIGEDPQALTNRKNNRWPIKTLQSEHSSEDQSPPSSSEDQPPPSMPPSEHSSARHGLLHDIGFPEAYVPTNHDKRKGRTSRSPFKSRTSPRRVRRTNSLQEYKEPEGEVPSAPAYEPTNNEERKGRRSRSPFKSRTSPRRVSRTNSLQEYSKKTEDEVPSTTMTSPRSARKETLGEIRGMRSIHHKRFSTIRKSDSQASPSTPSTQPENDFDFLTSPISRCSSLPITSKAHRSPNYLTPPLHEDTDRQDHPTPEKETQSPILTAVPHIGNAIDTSLHTAPKDWDWDPDLEKSPVKSNKASLKGFGSPIVHRRNKPGSFFRTNPPPQEVGLEIAKHDWKSPPSRRTSQSLHKFLDDSTLDRPSKKMAWDPEGSTSSLPASSVGTDEFGLPTMDEEATSSLPASSVGEEEFGLPTMDEEATSSLPTGSVRTEAFGLPTMDEEATSSLPTGSVGTEEFGLPTMDEEAKISLPASSVGKEEFGLPTMDEEAKKLMVGRPPRSQRTNPERNTGQDARDSSSQRKLRSTRPPELEDLVSRRRSDGDRNAGQDARDSSSPRKLRSTRTAELEGLVTRRRSDGDRNTVHDARDSSSPRRLRSTRPPELEGLGNSLPSSVRNLGGTFDFQPSRLAQRKKKKQSQQRKGAIRASLSSFLETGGACDASLVASFL